MTDPNKAKSPPNRYPSAARIKWFHQQLRRWGELNLRDFPWRSNISPYNLLVAESLLQKTDATTVAPIYQLFLERYFGLQGERVKSRCKILWGAADAIAPKKDVGKWNLILLDFGALVCTARNPDCDRCPLSLKCDLYQSIPNGSN